MKSQHSPALISAGQTSLECSEWSWILSSVGQRRPREWLRESIPGGEETQAKSQRDKWRNLGCLPRTLKDLGEWSWFLCLRNSQVSMWIWPMWPSRVWPGPIRFHLNIGENFVLVTVVPKWNEPSWEVMNALYWGWSNRGRMITIIEVDKGLEQWPGRHWMIYCASVFPGEPPLTHSLSHASGKAECTFGFRVGVFLRPGQSTCIPQPQVQRQACSRDPHWANQSP